MSKGLGNIPELSLNLKIPLSMSTKVMFLVSIMRLLMLSPSIEMARKAEQMVKNIQKVIVFYEKGLRPEDWTWKYFMMDRMKN